MLKKACILALASASLVFAAPLSATPRYADAVVSYKPGTGVDARFTNHTSCVLGEPTRINSWGDVDPFNPPYGTNQILTIGTGGSLVVKFNSPIVNHPGNRGGLDFIIFGNSGFVVTNYDPITWELVGPATTDGSLFADQQAGATRVSVSRDGTNFFVLNPALAPTVDRYFPTDPSGSFHVPPPPSLGGSSFAGATLESIRTLYAGSAGGAAYDIAWAQDTNGNPIVLSAVSYVRIDVTSGHSEIEALSAVCTNVIYQPFAANPSQEGWKSFGYDKLFHWTSNQNLQVTWDSSKPNSYFYVPLGTILSKSDDFSVSFDLTLQDFAIGVNPSKLFTFEIAFGFQRLANATDANFRRGTGRNLPNLAEFDFFPDSDYGATIWPCYWTTNGVANPDQNDHTILDLPTGVPLHITMSYHASNLTTVTTITTNGVPIGEINPVVLHDGFTDFRLDTFSVSSYSDAGAGGSLLAHGTVDNLCISLPPPPIQQFRGGLLDGTWAASFLSRTNWSYALESTADFKSWTEVSDSELGDGESLVLRDRTPATAAKQFYRVKSRRLD